MLKFTNHIGLDIGSDLIKLVQIESDSNNKFRLTSIGQIQTPVLANQIDLNLAKAEAIKKLVKEAKVTTHQAVISLSESQVYTRVIEMPVLPEEELAQAIRWQAEQYIPVPLSDVVLKHQILSKNEQSNGPPGKLSVLLVAAPNKLLNNFVSLLSSAGLETIAVETEILAVARALVGEDINSPTSMLVHMGSENTTLAVLSRGNLILTQAISTGGSAITRSIVATLGLEVNQAEEYKKTYGLDVTKFDGKVVAAIKPVIELLLAELKRVLAFYNVHGAADPVKRVVLSGGTALIPGLIPFLTENLGIEAQVGNPFLLVNLSDKQKLEIGDTGPIFSTAVGLALKPT